VAQPKPKVEDGIFGTSGGMTKLQTSYSFNKGQVQTSSKTNTLRSLRHPIHNRQIVTPSRTPRTQKRAE
ncbi:hypothetical protein Ancab_014489, partial [Ancistrocladus abbreviatus]